MRNRESSEDGERKNILLILSFAFLADPFLADLPLRTSCPHFEGSIIRLAVSFSGQAADGVVRTPRVECRR